MWDALGQIGQRLPTYCIFPYECVGHGAVAGIESSGRDEVITLAVTQAARILSGEKVDDIPVVHPSGTQTLADWRQLRRWKIPESALPKGTQFYNRDPSVWERDRKYIFPAIGLIIAQALLIAGLLWQRARKRKAESVLRESEERFRVMADTTPSMIWMCDPEGNITYINERWLAFTGRDPRDGYEAWIAFIHPEDVKNVMTPLLQALKDQKAFSKEYRLHRNDGVYRWMFDVASPRVNGDGSFAGFIGSAIDMTDQKLAQQALEKVSGRLIEAQEKERSRIARELHDDICQRLALLSIELDRANRARSGPAISAQATFEEVRKHCVEIASDVQSLAHQLHSSRLDHLGIVAAIKGFCVELAKRHAVNVEFTDHDVPGNLPKDVSLCLFRIAQEALHNAVKYSGVSELKVELYRMADELHLVVTDKGAGFDVQEARRKGGLGLLSMQERIHLVHGRLNVESAPGLGTRVIATVPWIFDEKNPIDERVLGKLSSVTRGS